MHRLRRLMFTTGTVLGLLTPACVAPEGRDGTGFVSGNLGTVTGSDGTPTSSVGTTSGESTGSASAGSSESTGHAETTTSSGASASSGGSTSNEPGTTGEACDDPPGIPVGPEYSLGPKFEDHYAIYDLGEVPGVDGVLGGTVIRSSDPDSLLIIGSSGFPPAQLFKIGISRGTCGHVTGFQGVAQAIADVPQAQSIIFAGGELMLVTVTPTNRLYQVLLGEDTPLSTYDFDVMKEVQHSASGIGVVPTSYGLAVPTLCFSSYPLGAFTCGELKLEGPLAELVGLKELSTYGPGNGFAYLPDDLHLPVFAPNSMLGSTTVFDDVVAYRCDKDGIPIYESGEPFVIGHTHNVSIDPIAGDILVSAVDYDGTPFNHLLVVRPRTLIAN